MSDNYEEDIYYSFIRNDFVDSRCGLTKSYEAESISGYEDIIETAESTQAVSTEAPEDDTMVAESELTPKSWRV